MPEEEPLGVLRVERIDIQDSYVIVYVFCRGPKPLDLELVASEGESAWDVTIKESELQNFKSNNNQASDAVWEAALKSALLREKPPADLSQELRGLEVVSTITPDRHISLIFRRNIGELTQRLATIELEPTNEDKFDLWVGCAAGARLSAEAIAHVHELEDKLEEQAKNNRKLQEQLQDLIKAKEEHEDALLHKFVELLNAKKLKIRDQQRLLSMATVDTEKVERAQGSAKSRKPDASRTSKRKATATALDNASDGESSDGFEDTNDAGEGNEDEEMRDVSTPEPLEDDETDDDEDEAVPSPPPKLKKGIRKNLAGKATEPTSSESQLAPQSAKSSKQAAQASREQPEEVEEPPPRRELPFTKRKAAQEAERKVLQRAAPSRIQSAASAPAPSGGDGDDTTDDDEL